MGVDRRVGEPAALVLRYGAVGSTPRPPFHPVDPFDPFEPLSLSLPALEIAMDSTIIRIPRTRGELFDNRV